MKTILAALTAALLAATLSACGDSAPIVGTVVSKHYDDADTYMVPQTIVGPKGGVSTTLVQHYDPECYQITVHDEREDKNRSTCIDPMTYADLKVGDYFEEGSNR